MKIFEKLVLLLALLLVFGCNDDNDDNPGEDKVQTDSIYMFIEAAMHHWYLWNDELVNVDYELYETPQDYVDALTVSRDKWSFVDKAGEVNQHFEEGKDFGYGFYLGWDSETYTSGVTTLRVMFVYNKAKAYQAGIRRGWTLLKIDGIPVDKVNFDNFFSLEPGSMKFTFKNHEAQTVEITLTKENYNMNAVLHSSTYEIDNKTVGYVVYQSFLGYSENELLNTMDNFKAKNIDELIVDLRYNTGGYITLAQDFANIITTSDAIGKVFFEMKHNKERSEENDETYLFSQNARNLNLKRVFFITNDYSASASELLINGLTPHMGVYQIGGRTHGKPVAMYGFQFQDWVFYPVTAKSVNADGYGDYFNGIGPDKSIFDEYHYDWGDENEPALSEALHYIQYGSFKSTRGYTLKTTRTDRAVGGKKLYRNLLIVD